MPLFVGIIVKEERIFFGSGFRVVNLFKLRIQNDPSCTIRTKALGNCDCIFSPTFAAIGCKF